MNILAIIVVWSIILLFFGYGRRDMFGVYEDEDVVKTAYFLEVVFCGMYTAIRIIIHLLCARYNMLMNNTNEFYITICVLIGVHLVVALIVFIIFLFKNTDIRGRLFITSCLILCGLLPVTIFAHLLTSITIIMSIVTLITGIYYALSYTNKI